MGLLSIGTSALLTSQGNLSTTSHNISNVNTEGYTRQRADQSTLPPEYYAGKYFGTGVEISTIERLYDQFLGAQVRTYTSQEAQQSAYYSYASQIDDMIGSEQLSINKGLSAFFDSVQELANDPTSISARQLMLTQGELLANRFNTFDSQLGKIDEQINTDVIAAVDEINNISKGIAELNQAILEARGTGTNEPNDLLDKRDLLITQLSKIVSVTPVMQSNGLVNVTIGKGQVLVAGTTSFELTTNQDNSTTPPRIGVAYASTLQDITNSISGGSLGGAIEFRTTLLDDTKTELDLLAQSLVVGFNTVHNNTTNLAAGGDGSEDLDGNDGGNFFDPASITAGTISIVITDPRQIAASSKVDPGVGNNENALALAELQHDKTLVTISPTVSRSLSQHYSVMFSDVATRTRQAEVSQESQLALLQDTQTRFDAVGGVNLDEEAANLIKFQQAYQAASQIIVVSNTVFESLINAV